MVSSIFLVMKSQLSSTKKHKAKFTSFLLAVVASLVVMVAAYIVRHNAESSKQPLPGITIEPLLSPNPRIVVTSVRSESEAELAGIKAGNIIVAIDDHPVSISGDVVDALDGESTRTVHVSIDDRHQIRAISLHRIQEPNDGP